MKSIEDPEKRFLLIIGVGRTQLPGWSLPVTEKDAQDVAELFSSPYTMTENTLVLTNENATREGIADGFRWLQERTRERPDSTAIVYHSGHGVRLPDVERFSYFLFVHDTKFPFDGSWTRYNAHVAEQGIASEEDVKALVDTAIPASEFSTWIKSISAKRLVIFLDCCHAQAMAQFMSMPLTTPLSSAIPGHFLHEISGISGRAIISSSTDEQNSWILADHENSVFTECLIKACQEPTAYRDGQIGIMGVFPFIAAEVRRAVQDNIGNIQQPLFSAQNLTADIPLIYELTGTAKRATPDKMPAKERAHLMRIQQTEKLYDNLQKRLVAVQRDLETRITEVDRVPLIVQRKYLFEELENIAEELDTLYGSSSSS
jgi:hypothetical protein